MSGTAAKAFKANLVTVCQTLFTSAAVSYGPAGTWEPDDLVEVLDVRSTQVPGPMSPLRARDETLEADIAFTCYRGGGAEVQQLATEAAFDMLRALETYLADSGQIASLQQNLGGVVLWARVTGVAMTEANEDISEGRTTTVGATVTARARI